MLGSLPDSLRVGLFSNIYRPIISGVVNSIDLLRKELLNQGHCPFVFAPRIPGYRDGHSGVWRFPSVHFRQVNYPVALPLWPPTTVMLVGSPTNTARCGGSVVCMCSTIAGTPRQPTSSS